MPRKIIKDRLIVDDTYTLVRDASELPSSGDVLIDIAIWADVKEQLGSRDGKVGLLLGGDAEPSAVADDVNTLDLISIEFPVFRDGRGYSLARIIRERMAFKGELRASGDVLRDQLYYLQRCGFNSFATREDRCIEEALHGLSDFTVTYQADAFEKRPIYLRRP
jgi:uncharacterized protein (DUF934 family)